MSDFRFACPACGQRIVVDSIHRGREITCPDCHKPLTVPKIRAPARPARAADRSASAGTKEQGTRTSRFALASLSFSMALGVGCVPGIVCGHLAQLRLRRNPTLRGKMMARTGLIISYASLVFTVVFLSYGFLVVAPPSGRQLSTAEAAVNTAEALASRLVDRVEVGGRDSELAHDLKGYRSRTGTFMDRTAKPWRDAVAGGSFSYNLKVDPARPMTLYCTYWGNDAAPGRRFDVLVNGKVIATQTLDFNDPGHYFEVEYKIPKTLTRGTNRVTVTFQAYPDTVAGGLFDLQMVRR